MEKYIGTKLIEAKVMNLGDYNKYKGWTIPEDEDSLREGYLVKYSDNYTSWSPKEIFEDSYNKINGNYLEIHHDLFSNDNTYVAADEKTFNAPHSYLVLNSHNDKLLGAIHFQEGGLKSTNQNGVFMEDLIYMCINRLDFFQESEYNCLENYETLIKLQEALMWLRKRQNNRIRRKVLGKNEA